MVAAMAKAPSISSSLVGMLSAVHQVVRCPLHSNWRLARNGGRHGQGSLHQFLLGFIHLGHETTRHCLLRLHLSGSEAELIDQALGPDALGEALQSANISSQAHVHLLHAEPGVLGAKPDVHGCDHVNTCTNTGVMDSANYWLPALLHLGDEILQLADGSVHGHGLPCDVVLTIHNARQLAKV